jgi:hypothetical protein
VVRTVTVVSSTRLKRRASASQLCESKRPNQWRVGAGPPVGRSPGAVPEGFPDRSSAVADEISDLREKIQTVAVAGEDEIVILTRTDTEADFDQATKRELSNDYGVKYDNFEDMSNKLEEDIESSLEEMRSSDKIEGDLPEDVEITFKSYEEVTPRNG